MAAACATKAEVLALAPELTDNVQLDLIVEITCAMLSVEAWGDKLSLGHALLAAHYATDFQTSSGAKGVVTSRTIDKLSESYATSESSASGFSYTKYGRLFDKLRASLSQASGFGEPEQGWVLPENRIL